MPQNSPQNVSNPRISGGACARSHLWPDHRKGASSAPGPTMTKIVTPDPENLELQVSRHTSGIPCSSEKQQLERHGVPQYYAKKADVL